MFIRNMFDDLVPRLGLSVGLLACLFSLIGCTPIAFQEPQPASSTRPVVSDSPPYFDVQGHRGARGLKPENTLPAFETALDLMVTTLELDLHYTADGVVVIWHDDSLGAEKCHYLGGSGHSPSRRISDLTFDQVRSYVCASNPDANTYPDQDATPTILAGDDYRPISLQQLFAFVQDYGSSDLKTDAQRQNARQVHFNIETKRKLDDAGAIADGWNGVDPGPFERAIVDLVEAEGLVDRVIIQSFVHPSLWGVRTLNPNIRLAALTSRGRPAPADYAREGAAIWSPRYLDITPQLMQEAHGAGLQVIPWTVNEIEDMQRMIALGVDGIITDRPDRLLSILP